MNKENLKTVANNEIKAEPNPISKSITDSPAISAHTPKVKVYRKEVKARASGKTVTVYSGTRSDGSSVNFVFKCPIETESAAFEVSNVIGNYKMKKNIKDGEEYTNYTYYVQSCDFSEIQGEPLPL